MLEHRHRSLNRNCFVQQLDLLSPRSLLFCPFLPFPTPSEARPAGGIPCILLAGDPPLEPQGPGGSVAPGIALILQPDGSVAPGFSQIRTRHRVAPDGCARTLGGLGSRIPETLHSLRFP